MKRTVAVVILLLASTALGKSPLLRGEPQGAKQDMKEAGHDTKQAAKKTGRAVRKTTKKGAHKSAHAVRKGAAKVERKTAPQ